MATASPLTEVLTICAFSPIHRPKSKSKLKHAIDTAKFTTPIPNCFSTAGVKRSFLVQASNPKIEDKQSSVNSTASAFTSQEDLSFLWKLGVGSVAGGAVIKYGSVAFPEITRPNIIWALIIISTPVVVAVVLLIKQSRVK